MSARRNKLVQITRRHFLKYSGAAAGLAMFMGDLDLVVGQSETSDLEQLLDGCQFKEAFMRTVNNLPSEQKEHAIYLLKNARDYELRGDNINYLLLPVTLHETVALANSARETPWTKVYNEDIFRNFVLSYRAGSEIITEEVAIHDGKPVFMLGKNTQLVQFDEVWINKINEKSAYTGSRNVLRLLLNHPTPLSEMYEGFKETSELETEAEKDVDAQIKVANHMIETLLGYLQGPYTQEQASFLQKIIQQNRIGNIGNLELLGIGGGSKQDKVQLITQGLRAVGFAAAPAGCEFTRYAGNDTWVMVNIKGHWMMYDLSRTHGLEPTHNARNLEENGPSAINEVGLVHYDGFARRENMTDLFVPIDYIGALEIKVNDLDRNPVEGQQIFLYVKSHRNEGVFLYAPRNLLEGFPIEERVTGQDGSLLIPNLGSYGTTIDHKGIHHGGGKGINYLVTTQPFTGTNLDEIPYTLAMLYGKNPTRTKLIKLPLAQPKHE